MASLNDAFDILCEACEHECDEESVDSLVLDDLEDEIEDDYDEVEEFDDEDVFYAEEMVPIISLAKGKGYIIESDMLGKYMKSNNITDPEVALNKIAEHNGINANETAVLIENADYFVNIINEAKSCKGTSACNKKKAKLKDGLDLLKNLKNKGIKLLKKKKTSKKKKK